VIERAFPGPHVEPRPLRLALLGSRGIPARYGGYETLMEELGPRLVERGHQVTVYCRSHVVPRDLEEHRGCRLVVLPTVRSKHLDTPVHTLLSTLHAGQRAFDAALVVNSANAIFVPLLRAADIPVALHVDGIERRRAKWGAFGRAVYAASERLALRVADEVITDADVIARHYAGRYGAATTTITYGVDPDPEPGDDVLRRLGLERGRYLLYVSRFEPENNPHRVAQAYRAVPGTTPLVMVGDAPYARSFIDGFVRDADPRIVFPGGVYGREYRQLQRHALAYVHATEVGGTHPALVEAMGYGNCVVVNDTPENREVAGDAGLYFEAARPETLSVVLAGLLAEPGTPAELGRRAAIRAAERYSWDNIASRYEELFRRLAWSLGTIAAPSPVPGAG
jgi:glycosyltransferase involved in cell wall biosynthesis